MDYINEPRFSNVRLNQNPSELKVKQTFFFQRISDGKNIPVEDPSSAWEYYFRKRDSFKYLGQSDGKKFMAGLKEAHKIFAEQGLEASQERIRQAIEEEVEVAKLNTNPPINGDVMGNGADYVRSKMSKYAK